MGFNHLTSFLVIYGEKQSRGATAMFMARQKYFFGVKARIEMTDFKNDVDGDTEVSLLL